MKNLIVVFIIGTLVSCYFFPFGLSFLSKLINTKMILAMVGGILVFYEGIQDKRISLPLKFLGGLGFAILFSLACFVSSDINHTVDYSYATYFISFFVWLGGAYVVCAAIRLFHGKTSFRLLTIYLTGVCVTQCILALLIDRIRPFKILVNTYIVQGQDFVEKVDRLYGIGASLDSAGVRFSIVLLMIMALLSKDRTIRLNIKDSILLLFAFFVISVIGNMISRTTSVGMIMGLVYFLFSTGVFRALVKVSHIRLYFIFGAILLIVVFISVYLYKHDNAFHQNIRFAFEGFFNWMDTGEWRTSSTDKLNNVMWIWPADTKSWIIGTGLFGNYVYSTDIGYCRFILYCGIVGFSLFASFFIYNSCLFCKLLPLYKGFFVGILLLTFIVWLKVATDLFLIYALFYCMDLNINDNQSFNEENNEDSLLHSCYL
ncbi:MAG: hypothetical protein LKI39_16055 [Bacteroides sp.]|jgi:hypothetical protein|nr:hypothetical protein [Bacteroides sp.]MCI1684045.1 hypothetical protein [Bacteroides sp.]